MPPPKGHLSAYQAVLSLFAAGPETQSNIRRRLREEYESANWSRSVVDAAVPALVAQGLLVLVTAGTKPAESVYEITADGIEAFNRHLRDTPRVPEPLRDPLQLWIEHSTRAELPVILAVIKENETVARKEVDAAQKRLNSERTLGRLGPANGSDWNGRVRNTVLSDRVRYWQGRVARCINLRRDLMGGHNLHRPADDPGDTHG
jgi:DNA-binding PadR family transcriptional regulator